MPEVLEVKALATRVLVVAVRGDAGDWAAYINAVPGKNHDEEYEEVVKHGAKLSRNLAEVMFPQYKHLKWRY